jgi:hypothetical protein
LNDHRIRKIETNEAGNITEAQLASEVGKQNLISTYHWATRSVYKIRRVENRVMPEVTLPSKSPDYALIKTMWNMLERTRLRQDPIAKDRVQQVARPREPEVLRTLADLSEEAISLVRQLVLQPSRDDGSKELSQNMQIVLRMGLLNNVAKRFLNTDLHWPIEAWPVERILVLYETESDNQPCDLETLKTTYTQVLSQIGLNWERSNLRDYPNIQWTQSEEDHVLFVKNEDLRYEERSGGFVSIDSEDRLTQSIANGLGIGAYLRISSDWKNNPPRPQPVPRQLYLWIKKDKLELVTRLLNLREPS